MSIYKTIFQLPFRDFTLNEFVTWRAVLVEYRKNDKKCIVHDDAIQIVYYYLALSCYYAASHFLTICNKDDAQVIFLALILWQWESDDAELVNNNITNDEHLKTLIHLGLIGYAPSLLIIAKKTTHWIIEFAADWETDWQIDWTTRFPLGTFNTSSRRLVETLSGITKYSSLDDVFDDLYKLKQNMIDAHIDEYYINDFQDKINDVELYDTNSHRPICDVRDSNLSNLELLTYGKRMGIFDFEDGVSPKEVIKDIVNEIMGKIVELDTNIISSLLKDYIDSIGHIFNQNPGALPFLIKFCINQMYDYLLNDGDNMCIMTLYFQFCCLNHVGFDERYLPLCKKLLKDCISKGFLYLPFTRDNLVLEKIYKKFCFDHYDVVSENDIPVIVDLIEHCFWSTPFDNSYEYTFNNDDIKVFKNTNIKVYPKTHAATLTFYFLLKLSSQLWEASLCVLGANFRKGIIHQPEGVTKRIRLIDQLTMYVSRNSDISLSNYNYLTNNMLTELSNIISRHAQIFKTSFLGLSELQKRSFDINSNGYRNYDNIHTRVSFLFELCIIANPFIQEIDLHLKYKPDGECYASIKEDFDNKAKR